jgi:hypothetical protein
LLQLYNFFAVTSVTGVWAVTSVPVGIVERYLSAVTGHDWEGVGVCVSDDVVRVGPYGDVYEGRDDYVAFLAALMPTLRGYGMEVHRVAYSADGRVGTAELTETVEMDGRVVVTPESLVFDISDAGLITRIGVYLQRSKP